MSLYDMRPYYCCGRWIGKRRNKRDIWTRELRSSVFRRREILHEDIKSEFKEQVSPHVIEERQTKAKKDDIVAFLLRLRHQYHIPNYFSFTSTSSNSCNVNGNCTALSITLIYP